MDTGKFMRLKVTVPEGERGPWKVERFTIGKREEETQRMRAMFAGGGRYVPRGTYTRLTRNSQCIMSDTPDELHDHLEPFLQARGRCLVHGLGLGALLHGICNRAQHVTVVEIDPDVIALVGPHYEAMYQGRLTIINDDALTWKPPRNSHWDMVWHDIWDTICDDNLPDMKRLHRRFGRRAAWQGSWARHLLQR